MERIIKAVLFVILILALGLASTSTRLLAQEWIYYPWEYCPLCNLGLDGLDGLDFEY